MIRKEGSLWAKRLGDSFLEEAASELTPREHRLSFVRSGEGFPGRGNRLSKGFRFTGRTRWEKKSKQG